MAVRRLSEGPEETGSVAFVPFVEAWAVTVAADSQRTSAMLLGRKCTPGLQSNDTSTTDAAAGHLRTNGHLFQEQQGRPVNLIAQHNLFSCVGGCCRRTSKPSAGNLSRIHDLSVKFSSSLCESLSQDGSLGHGVGGPAIGGAVASHVRSRNLTDARDRTSVERR